MSLWSSAHAVPLITTVAPTCYSLLIAIDTTNTVYEYVIIT